MARADAAHALLDAAERLFAERGIAGVSDRKIAEMAGNSNHSAVGYHFGGREGLLRALLERHQEQLVRARREMLASADSLAELVHALVAPQIRLVESLGIPSWRARFLSSAFQEPVARTVLAGQDGDPLSARSAFESVCARLEHLDRDVVARRAQLMGHMVITVCATLEARESETGEAAAWGQAVWFLCDAIEGMLAAPVSPRPGA